MPTTPSALDKAGWETTGHMTVEVGRNFSSWLESALLGLLVIPGVIMISILLIVVLLAAVMALLALLIVRKTGAGRTKIMASP
jgi:hypothetical protein